MTVSVRQAVWQYEMFISYSRKSDELRPFVQKLVACIKNTFRELTGLEARIFVDSSEVSTAMLWQRRIESALTASAVLIAVETPSYYTSAWCLRELNTFLILENQRRDYYQLLPYEALIFPVRRVALSKLVETDAAVKAVVQQMVERQSADLVDLDPDSELFISRVEELTVSIISVLQKTMQPDFNAANLLPSTTEPQTQFALATPLVTTYAGADHSKLAQLLVEAQGVTIVGTSHEGLADLLEKAIDQRSRKYLPQHAFWDHLNIVFLADDLLPYVSDGLSIEFPEKARALQERTRRHAWSRRRLMSLLLRDGVPGRWTLYSYPSALPFLGALFAMSDNRRVVQLRIMRPSRQENDYLNIEFIDRVDQFFESAFREIVEASAEEHEIVLIGSPGTTSGTFLCRGSRYRRSVLIEDRNIADWLVAIVAITWRQSRNGPEPLLQINTPRNSTREIGKASHVSGYVNYRDNAYLVENLASLPSAVGDMEYSLPQAAVINALRRELADDFGIQVAPDSTTITCSANFYYPDKENIYFYVLQQEIDATYKFASDTQMFAWTVAELLTVRRHHVLLNSRKTLTVDMTSRQRNRAGELVVANLLAQGDAELASDVRRAVDSRLMSEGLASRLETEIERSKIYKYVLGRELQVEGLAGFQYRTFYSVVLPAYANVGIYGAREELAAINENAVRATAVAELASYYDDETFITSFPIEV
jgi:hypothetical protein